MNQAQRNYLIKKIEENAMKQIRVLSDCKKDVPSVANYLLHGIMSGTIEYRTIEEIKEAVLQKALSSDSRNSLLGSGGFGSRDKIEFKPDEIFIIPQAYRDMQMEIVKANNEIQDQINQLQADSNTLITRIQLASDKTLQSMINEVDDMGDIKLMTEVLKTNSLGPGATQKQLK